MRIYNSHILNVPYFREETDKAKSYPQPIKKQYRVHNLPKSKSGATTLGKARPRYVPAYRKRDLCFPGAWWLRIAELPWFSGFSSLPLWLRVLTFFLHFYMRSFPSAHLSDRHSSKIPCCKSGTAHRGNPAPRWYAPLLKYLFFLNLHTKKGQGRDTVMYCLSALNY